MSVTGGPSGRIAAQPLYAARRSKAAAATQAGTSGMLRRRVSDCHRPMENRLSAKGLIAACGSTSWAELVFLRNSITCHTRRITLNGKRGRLTTSLAAACGSINVGRREARRYPRLSLDNAREPCRQASEPRLSVPPATPSPAASHQSAWDTPVPWRRWPTRRPCSCRAAACWGTPPAA